ncbi:hypothetical protein ACFE04_005551 [Oxalis oulophora]
MIDDKNPRVSSDDSNNNNNNNNNNDANAQSRQRKKRRWDQPADTLVSAGVTLPLSNMGFLGGSSRPTVIPPLSAAFFTNPLAGATTCANLPTLFQTPTLLQNQSAVVPKVNQSMIQDELIIAREIVINDAESSIRYKLTKRQTQEEIQKCTGAVVITRFLKDTTERILAVDRAAAMVEELLKPDHLLQPTLATICNGLKVTQPLISTSVYLGFDADPSLNIVARIRGPNDQYMNHIMNETGATVLLRGSGSGNSEIQQGEEPLHLFLSSNNSKSLEDAKRLAEHLLDTISMECGASSDGFRVSSSKVYGAVPPPQQLLTGVTSTVTCLAPAGGRLIPVVSCGVNLPNMAPYPPPIISGGTSYSGYDGIYPQATPLQQVALALRQTHTPINSVVPPTPSLLANTASNNLSSSSSSEKEKRRRKFQELPSTVKPAVNSYQVFSLTFYEANRLIRGPLCVWAIGLYVSQDIHFLMEGVLKSNKRSLYLGDSITQTMPAPDKMVPSSMPPPPPKFTSSLLAAPPSPPPPPPPPPKFSSSSPVNDMTPTSIAMSILSQPLKLTSTVKFNDTSNSLNKTISSNVPDTLIKLMEYGDEDDDLEETDEDVSSNSSTAGSHKPFWAV